MKTERFDPAATVVGPAGAGGEDDDQTIMPQAPRTSSSLPGASGYTGNERAVRQVGRYQILEKIGEGAMATVYKAHDPSINRALAIKFLHPRLCEDPEYRARFLREARAAGMLSHPNIVTVFDVGEIEGRPYIAMELLEGGPLGDEKQTSRGLPIREVLDIGIQLAKALDFAHSKGIVHRDIKPSNILRVHGTSTIKVTDFGIARIETPEMTEQTRVGTVLGTPNYMSPEQAMGQKVDARSDLFSVGVMLYQLLTGKRPFEGDSVVTLVLRIAKEDPKPLDLLRKDVPPALRRVADRCLNKAPERRFQSGRELAEALIKVSRELNEEADSKGRPRGVSLRVKWTAIMAAVVAVTMALTSAFVTSRQQRAMMGEMIAHGAALSKLIATESAVPALSEDWVAIDVFAQEVMKALGLQGLAVIDHKDVVRVSSNPEDVGKPYQRAQGVPLVTRDQSVSAQRAQTGAGVDVLDFEVPVTFQNKQVGKVRLALYEAPLTKLARQSWALMVLLLLVTVLAVVVATYFIAANYSKPIRLLRDSMIELGKGNPGYRIAETRNDEFGLLYRIFDQLAEQIERRQGMQGPDSRLPPLVTPSVPPQRTP
jgi:serine/threonine protein kinase/HAMP domain-containing protein